MRQQKKCHNSNVERRCSTDRRQDVVLSVRSQLELLDEFGQFIDRCMLNLHSEKDP